MSPKERSIVDVAVVVACRNEGRHLAACIQSLIEATKGRAKLMFVDDGSTDQSLQILESFSDHIEILHSPGKGPGHARNLAWKSTPEPLLAFLDADTKVSHDWLDQMQVAWDHRGDSVAAIGGAQGLYEGAGARERGNAELLKILGFVSDYLHAADHVKKVRHNPSCNVVYDRRALEQADGFDENFWPCEDLDLDLRLGRLGWTMLFTPHLRIQHRRPESFWGLCRMMNRYGFGHAKLIRKHGPCQPIHGLPTLILAAVLLHIFAFQRYAVDVLLADAALVSFALGFFYARTRCFSKTLRYFIDTFCMVIAWNIGLIMGITRKTGRARPRV